MSKRTIEISREPAYLSVKLDQLVLKRGEETVGSIPCEDIGVVLVDHPATTYSHAALVRLAESQASLVVCGRDHLPAAILMPISDHTEVVWRLKEQLAASAPVRKQLWKQITRAKIRAQAQVLKANSSARSKLLDLAQTVRSGDPANVEAQAARIYWMNWLPGEAFRRDADADGLNGMLNYGYAVVRAAIARAIVAAGYHPSIGLKHSNRGNAFCLADDLIEPLRPMVDWRVREIYRSGAEKLDQEAKAELLRLLADETKMREESGPLMNNLHRYVASMGKCFRRESKRLEIPKRDLQSCN
jgi:CRISP-associated protein Cas1